WISASESRPEYHQQSTRWLCLRFGFQTASPRCFSRELVTPLRQAAVYNEKGENRSRRSPPADSPRLMTASGMQPVFFVQQQPPAPLSAFPALPGSQAPQCTDSPGRGERHVLLRTRRVHAGAAASEGIPRDLQRRAS